MSDISVQEVVTHLRNQGFADISRRAVRRLYLAVDNRMGLRSLEFPLDPADIAERNAAVRPRPQSEGPLDIAWICTPAIPGAGGHTTFFRMVQGMEERGHRCTILLYNRKDESLERHRAVIKRCWPGLRAEIQPMPQRITGYDACVASSWETAHVLAVRGSGPDGPRPYYFIQDYEPYFHPRGSLYALAEDSYRLGFSHLALGPMVAATLKHEVGVDADVIPFGSDLGTYCLKNTGARSGVVFFAKPAVERRGYDMGRLALQAFHRLHPDQEIHIYGTKVKGWGIPLTQHGTLPPGELNDLYNRTVTGLALSFTNITLVAAEMLAAGNIPVLNDHQFSRAVLTNPEAVWAAASPTALAEGLSAVVKRVDIQERSIRAASHREHSWDSAQAKFAEALTGKPDELLLMGRTPQQGEATQS
jgi:hypothetical protein